MRIKKSLIDKVISKNNREKRGNNVSLAISVIVRSVGPQN